jgi:hypothetical protein
MAGDIKYEKGKCEGQNQLKRIVICTDVMKVKCVFKFIVLKQYNFRKTVLSFDFAEIRIVYSKCMQKCLTSTTCRR